jgi:hypothetical protein
MQKAMLVIEWVIPFTLVGVIVAGTGWVLFFG